MLKIEKAMSILRVNGNEIMHTGEIKIFESQEQVLDLFVLFNMIIEDLIETDRKIDDLFNKMSSTRGKVDKKT